MNGAHDRSGADGRTKSGHDGSPAVSRSAAAIITAAADAGTTITMDSAPEYAGNIPNTTNTTSARIPHSAIPPTIRPATPSDVPAVLRLIRGLADYERLTAECTATETGIADALFAPLPRIHAILAESETTAIGLALYYFTFSTFKARPMLFLEDLFVEPAHRGSGAGLALMRHIAGIALAENCLRMEWRVLNWNQPSIRFYERLGATADGDWHTRQLGGEALAALAKGTSHG
jgi:GNAT superfamily N-acetyltransferase